MARIGIGCGIWIVWFFYSHFNLGRRPDGAAERWGEFWTWAFLGRDGPAAMIVGFIVLNVSIFLRLLTWTRDPDSVRTIPLLLLISSGLSAAVMFLLALIPICFR